MRPKMSDARPRECWPAPLDLAQTQNNLGNVLVSAKMFEYADLMLLRP